MTASLRVKNDKYYVVLTHTTDGKKNQTWVSTGLSVTGNEGKARQIMLDMLGEKPEQAAPPDMLFSDAVRRWLEAYSPLAAGHLARPQWKSDSLRGTTDRVAMGKYDKTETEDMKIVKRVAELAEKYDCKMSQIAIAWQWAKGIVSPIIGATKTSYLDDAAGAFNIKLTAEDIAYLEEPYVPHKIIGAIDKNPKQGVVLLDEKK